MDAFEDVALRYDGFAQWPIRRSITNSSLLYIRDVV